MWARFATGGVPLIGSPDEDPRNMAELTIPLIGCTYELGVLVHERAAWLRHVFGTGKPDLDAYLADVMPTGPIGLPNDGLTTAS